MLQQLDGTPFTTGKAPYSNRSPLTAGSSENRIWVIVQFGELARGAAVIDTGSPWCILSRAEAEKQDGNYRSEGLSEIKILVRGVSLSGVLLRWPVTLFAHEGDDLTIEGTIFIPDEEIGWWSSLVAIYLIWVVDPWQRKKIESHIVTLKQLSMFI